MELDWDQRLDVTVQTLAEMLYNEEAMQFTTADTDIRPAMRALLEYCCSVDQFENIMAGIEERLATRSANDENGGVALC